MFNNEVSVGNIIAVGAAILSAAAVLSAISKERDLRKKELADRVRQSTALVIAKLDRWKLIAMQMFDQLQQAATDADGLYLAKNDEIATRDYFWKQTVVTQAMVESVLDEQIEVAYSNLFGYDPRIHDLFTAVIARLRHIDSLVFQQVLNRTQFDILTIRSDGEHPVVSAQLGNRLRLTLARSRELLEKHMEAVLSKFRDGVTVLVLANDEALVTRNIAVPPPSILPDLESLREDIYSEPSSELRNCEYVHRDLLQSLHGPNMLEPWPLGISFPEDIQGKACIVNR